MRLQELYKKEIMPKMIEKFGYKNTMAVPKLKKVVINVGFGRNTKNKELIESIQENLKNITGQKAVLTKAKKSISSFKIREGLIIGAKVTLRGKRMYDFTEKLVRIAFPRVRDFRGISEKSVDKTGTLTVGFKEHLAFPEIKNDDFENVHGLEISLSTSAKTRESGLELFKLIGFPFKQQ